MRVTIVGGGKVGYSLASQLQREDHDVTVIDTNEQAIDHISNTLDVNVCVGNGASFPVLRAGGAEDCDLVIAVTASDEINMLCCLAAHKLGAKRTVARVRNPEYSGQLRDMQEDLGLSMTINPERAVAEEIGRILRFPAATQVEFFARSRVGLVSCRVSEGSVLDGLTLYELPKKVGTKVLICAVSRGENVMIPTGQFVLRGGDDLYLTGAPQEIEQTFRKAGLLTGRVKDVIIAGGSRTAFYLAKILRGDNIRVKIIECNEDRARRLAELLPDVSVLCGDVADHELLDEENIDKQDAFIALTGMDEGNILSALYADGKKVPKVIAKVNNSNLGELVQRLGLRTIITPKLVTAEIILCYVRALAAKKPGENVQSLYKLFDGRLEVLEFNADVQNDALLNIPLIDLKTKKDLLIACLVRDGHVIIPGGSDCILPGDSVLIVTAHQRLGELNDILENEI